MNRHFQHSWVRRGRATRTVLLSAAVALLGPSELVGRIQVDRTLDPPDGTCEIALHEDLELKGGAEELGGVAHPSFVVTDGRGRHYLSSTFAQATIQVFDSTGRYLTRFGRSGEGPREFLGIGNLLVGSGDTLHVFDVRARTYSVVSPEYDIVRRSRIQAQVFRGRALELEPGTLVLNADIRSPERFGYPLHLLSGDTLGATIGPDELGGSRPRPEPYAMNRALAKASDSTFFASRSRDYVFERWTTAGRRLQRLRGAPSWFEKEDPNTVRGRFNPSLTDLTVDREGHLWVLARVRSDDFDELAVERGRFRGTTGQIPIVESRTGETYDLQVSVLEVIDPDRGRVLASVRHPSVLQGFVGPDRVWTYEADDQGGRVILWRTELRCRDGSL